MLELPRFDIPDPGRVAQAPAHQERVVRGKRDRGDNTAVPLELSLEPPHGCIPDPDRAVFDPAFHELAVPGKCDREDNTAVPLERLLEPPRGCIPDPERRIGLGDTLETRKKETDAKTG